jgi:hypothetical protein
MHGIAFGGSPVPAQSPSTTLALDPLDRPIYGAKAISAALDGAMSESDIFYAAKRGLIPVMFEGRRLVTTLRRLRDHYAHGTMVESQPYVPKNPRGPLSAEMKAKQRGGRKRKSPVITTAATV